uniref:Uncharacterized protein n=1 Tax=Oryza brachyantha TaxID=4533 RepID=J3LIV6_ORYBR
MVQETVNFELVPAKELICTKECLDAATSLASTSVGRCGWQPEEAWRAAWRRPALEVVLTELEAEAARLATTGGGAPGSSVDGDVKEATVSSRGDERRRGGGRRDGVREALGQGAAGDG